MRRTDQGNVQWKEYLITGHRLEKMRRGFSSEMPNVCRAVAVPFLPRNMKNSPTQEAKYLEGYGKELVKNWADQWFREIKVRRTLRGTLVTLLQRQHMHNTLAFKVSGRISIALMPSRRWCMADEPMSCYKLRSCYTLRLRR